MTVDAASWLPLVTRTSLTSATATVTLTEPGATAREVSEHHLTADGMLHWRYTVRSDSEESRQSCDGREVTHLVGGRTIRSKVPAEAESVDDPWYFYSWPGAVDAWLVEMLRPVDLLARVVVSSPPAQHTAALLRIEAQPMGNEPSPYSGFSLPDGRSLTLDLDVARGCFTQVTVTHTGETGAAHRLDYQLTDLEL